jgi:FkbH-like protein
MKYSFTTGDDSPVYGMIERTSDGVSESSHTVTEQDISFPENIRLVIWDLDDTFWRGTISEGPINWVDEHEHIVKTLAARGIVSAICSKNDFAPTMEVIKARNLDAYFIYPSIDWSAKGPRIKAIIDNAQLRPETVLLIDDNHLNRAEAIDLNPGLNVVAETFIHRILDHGQFAGKDDHSLTRLAQYKAMELRKSDAAIATESGDDFLRNSGIKVYIEYNLEANIDRCVELINRSNQLNFTKRRLSDDSTQGRQEFLELLKDTRVQGGLIHCRDKYGDHGYVGFYLIAEGKYLKDFLFSCRVLGMGIEQWLYKRLGNPYLEIVGKVLSDPRNTSRNIDWIELVADKEGLADSEQAGHVVGSAKKIENFYVLGGCVMENIGHYLRVFSTNVVHEGNARRDNIDFRRTHTSFLVYRHLVGNPQFANAVRSIGCIREDFDNRIFEAGARSAIVLSFWFDQICPLYRHKDIPIDMPFLIDNIGWDVDVTTLNFEQLPVEFRGAKNAELIFRNFKENFRCIGYIQPNAYRERVRNILKQINPNTLIIILDVPSHQEGVVAERQIRQDMIDPIRAVHQELARERNNTYVIDPIACVIAPSDRLDWWHFDRKVYYRIYQRIAELVAEGSKGELNQH